MIIDNNHLQYAHPNTPTWIAFRASNIDLFTYGWVGMGYVLYITGQMGKMGEKKKAQKRKRIKWVQRVKRVESHSK